MCVRTLVVWYVEGTTADVLVLLRCVYDAMFVVSRVSKLLQPVYANVMNKVPIDAMTGNCVHQCHCLRAHDVCIIQSSLGGSAARCEGAAAYITVSCRWAVPQISRPCMVVVPSR